MGRRRSYSGISSYVVSVKAESCVLRRCWATAPCRMAPPLNAIWTKQTTRQSSRARLGPLRRTQQRRSDVSRRQSAANYLLLGSLLQLLRLVGESPLGARTKLMDHIATLPPSSTSRLDPVLRPPQHDLYRILIIHSIPVFSAFTTFALPAVPDLFSASFECSWLVLELWWEFRTSKGEGRLLLFSLKRTSDYIIHVSGYSIYFKNTSSLSKLWL